MSEEPPANDAQHLHLLSIFHYVVAGIQALLGSIPVLHFLFGAAFLFFPGKLGDGGEEAPFRLVGGFLMLFSGVWMLAGWSLAACTVIAGRNLARRRRYTFCLVMAAIEAAVCMPFGTVLGVFTIVVLIRPSVKALFANVAEQA